MVWLSDVALQIEVCVCFTFIIICIYRHHLVLVVFLMRFKGKLKCVVCVIWCVLHVLAVTVISLSYQGAGYNPQAAGGQFPHYPYQQPFVTGAHVGWIIILALSKCWFGKCFVPLVYSLKIWLKVSVPINNYVHEVYKYFLGICYVLVVHSFECTLLFTSVM